MGALVAKMVAVRKLEGRNGSYRPMFFTWSASKFGKQYSCLEPSNQTASVYKLFNLRNFAVEIYQYIYEVYLREFAIKIAVKDAFCLCTDRDTLVLLEAAWLQQPYIDERVSLNHEAMLQEVGCSHYCKK